MRHPLTAVRRPASGPARLRRSLVALLCGSLLLLTGCDFNGLYSLPLPGGPVSDDDSYQVTAEFADVVNITPKSLIKVDDVVVGEVTEISRVGWHAQVVMRIRDDVTLPANAVAEVRSESLLGERFIDLSPPTLVKPAGRLADGDRLTRSDTGRNAEIEEVLGATSMLLNGGGIGRIGRISRELNDAFDGRTQNTRDVLRSLRDVIGNLDSQRGEIISALTAVNKLTGTLNANRDILTDALDVAGPAVAVLRSQQTRLVGMLTALDDLGDVGTRVINSTRDDLLGTLDDLRPILRNLNKTGDSLVPGLSTLVSFPFPESAADIIQGDYADTIAVFDIDFNALFKDGVLTLPDVLPDVLPDNLSNLPQDVLDCLTSGKLAGPACRKVLNNLTQLTQLQQLCAKPVNKNRVVCRAVNALDLSGGSLLGGDGADGQGGGLKLPGLPGLPGLGGLLGRADTTSSTDPTDLRRSMTSMLTSGDETPPATDMFGAPA